MTQAQPQVDAVNGAGGSTIAVRPVVLAAADRGNDLQVRVTAPLTGGRLPVVLFSHGFGFSMDAYGPLADFWAAHGLVVVQPTHLDSVSLGLAADDPRGPQTWRSRIEDLTLVLDHLDTVIAAVPGLAGRVDTTRIAVTGHSYGATTASALLGARVVGPAGDPDEDFSDARVTAGILLCVAGLAGDELTPMAQQFFPFMNPDFGHLYTPSLIVAGDADQSMLSTRGPDWWTDAYRDGPGAGSLLILFGAQHGLGGIHAYGTIPQSAAESPATVTLAQQMTTAYLRTALGIDEASWTRARDALTQQSEPAGRVDQRSTATTAPAKTR